jgi:hypothetical protein
MVRPIRAQLPPLSRRAKAKQVSPLWTGLPVAATNTRPAAVNYGGSRLVLRWTIAVSYGGSRLVLR